jgi:hypothetical protein
MSNHPCATRRAVHVFIVALLCSLAVGRHTLAQQAASDPSLVLHYTFDYPPSFDNTGNIVKDHSGYGNHGVARNVPESRREVNGRFGVMRFGGEKTFIECGTDESLYFDGDMTFEMWVRLNGLVKPLWALLFGDDYNFTFGYQGGENLRLWYSGDLGSMIAPVDNTIINNDWSHIAVVVEYPRCRIYRNGELVRDQYLPMKGIKQVRNAMTYLAGRPDACCPVDLDEFRVYRRALTAAEIAAHAKDQQIAPVAVDELAVEPHWYEDKLAVRLSCKGTDYSGHVAEVTLLKCDYQTHVAPPQRVELTEWANGTGRYVATAVFGLSQLNMTSVDVRVRFLDGDGNEVKTMRRHASLRKPQWVDTREGYSDIVMPPYTPMETNTQASGKIDVHVWGRRYVFGSSPFLQRIDADDVELLAEPIALDGRIDGEAIAWQPARPSLVDSSQTHVSLEQSSSSGPLTLKINTSIEYDGYIIFDCELTAQRAVTLDELTLHWPVPTHFATLCLGMYAYPHDPDIPMAKNHSGAVDGDLSFRFSPNIWLGNEERGLLWQAESDQYWRNADEQQAIQILPRGETTMFRANWVAVPTELAAGETLHYKFALCATPTKPVLRDAWDMRIVRSDPYGEDLNLPDRMTDGKPTLEYYADAGIGHLFYQAHDICPYPTPVTEGYAEALRRLVEETHAAGLKLYPYLFHARVPVNIPEFDINGLHMVQYPLLSWAWGGVVPPPNYPGYHSDIFTEYGSKAQGVVIFCTKSMALQDAYIHSLAERFDEFGEDGVYLDGTGFTDPCTNTLHGCGYVDEDGKMHPTYPVFGGRLFSKRIYTVIKQRRPDAVIDHHQSQGQNTASLAWGDMLWTGEHWWHLRHTGAPDGYVAGEMTLDLFRTEFMGYPQGIAAETLSYRLGSRMEVSAISLLHDTPVRVRTQERDYLDMFTKLWHVRQQLGSEQSIEKLFYWNNQAYVTVTPEKCYSTLLRSEDNGVLAFISNLTRDAQDVTVHLNLDELELNPARIDVFNALTDEPVSMTSDGTLSIPLGSEEWVYVWLRPKSRR